VPAPEKATSSSRLNYQSGARSIMSQNPSFSSSVQPLSIGNIVSAALRIYRDRFKPYYILALKACLWFYVPVYGWAKSASLLALIARLAFHEVIERPEQVDEANRQIEPKMWKFLSVGIFAFLIFCGATIGSIIIFAILAIALNQIFTDNLGVFLLFLFATILIWLFGYIWLISRLFLINMPIAIEDVENKLTAASAISRSWQLTKGFVFKIQAIVFVAFIVSLPAWMIIYVFIGAVQVLFTFAITNSPNMELIFTLVIFLLNAVSNALIIPFWQAIQAVIYYDLRVRREGMGMEIRDSL
jgi:hypothetical protein